MAHWLLGPNRFIVNGTDAGIDTAGAGADGGAKTSREGTRADAATKNKKQKKQRI